MIVCPHCSTSYGIDPAKLGGAGRTVRCSRCKETWLARAEDAVEYAHQEAAAAAVDQHNEQDAAAEWDAMAREQDDVPQDTPQVESPSIAGDWQGSAEWQAESRNDQHDAEARSGRFPWLGRFMKPGGVRGAPRRKAPFNLATACVAMAAMVLAIVIWRAEMVRLLPQTAAFYKLVGLDVNLRGLRFQDVKVTTETVEGTSMLVIEGAIADESSKPVELPRLRFSIRDAAGTEIYAWNAVLEQSFLKPGEKAAFKSRLASPPPGGRNVEVRFFNKRDLTGGRA
ncbi:MJ0042-type zinc finger domain-containing protein [Bradyrhizobium sp.]|uniref:MJ0042-type zinc finger domain-containing protein n=1 Tax=Bradyrhizobium sp. TaxID=376 RepID=UPI002630D975|nr:MJ0042-type zinc finger domain-containing protein [Bradyrhizobium sp.]